MQAFYIIEERATARSTDWLPVDPGYHGFNHPQTAEEAAKLVYSAIDSGSEHIRVWYASELTKLQDATAIVMGRVAEIWAERNAADVVQRGDSPGGAPDCLDAYGANELQATYIDQLREDAEHERIESALLRA
jgi:hypothetical protein